jgi:hypothetical protein
MRSNTEKENIVKGMAGALMLSAVWSCSKKSDEPTFLGERHLTAGPVGAYSEAPDCRDMENGDPNAPPGSPNYCADRSLPTVVATLAADVSYVVIATVDLDTKKYAKVGSEEGQCCTGYLEYSGQCAEVHYVPYRLFKPELWLKGDGSSVRKIAVLGDCEADGLCDLWFLGKWYLSSGRNLLFLAEYCCLDEVAPGAKRLMAAYPIEGDQVYDDRGQPWPLDMIFESIKKGVTDPPPNVVKTIDGKTYYHSDVLCSELKGSSFGNDTTSNRDATSDTSGDEIYN